MRKLDCSRRAVLRLLASSAVAGWGGDRTAARTPVRAAPVPRSRATVVIDPGHGGTDPGAISPSGIYEKDIVLPTARVFARELTKTGRYRVVLTRRADKFIALHDRVARARACRADVFVSIHANALPDAAMRGLSVFTLSAAASDRQAAALAANENRADRVGGVALGRQLREVGEVLADLARRQTSNLSIELASTIVDELEREVVLLDHPQRSADFAVLTAPDIPSALVELGCLSNRKEERLLQRRAYQHRLARALTRAIEVYFAAQPVG